MLVATLPRDSATRHGVVGEAKDWGRLEYLIAELIDVVQLWSWAQLGSKKVRRPEPIRRPGDGDARTPLSHAQQYALLLEQRARRR